MYYYIITIIIAGSHVHGKLKFFLIKCKSVNLYMELKNLENILSNIDLCAFNLIFKTYF